MKHNSLRALSLLLVFTAVLTAFAVGCTQEDSPADTAADTNPAEAPTETDGVTQQETLPDTAAPETDEPTESPATDVPTEAPTEPETEPETEPDPPETDKFVLSSFDDGDPTTVLRSLDWTTTPYGITNPVMSAADRETDLGTGLCVTLPAGAICQSLVLQTEAVKQGFADAAAYKYLRVWVCNRAGGAVSLGIFFEANGGTAVFSGDSIIAVRCDGKEIALSKNDASGMGTGHNSAIAIPTDFEGWICFPLDKLMQNWDYAFSDDLTSVFKLTFDLRPAGCDADGYYILDEISLTNSVYGQRRKASGASIMTTNEEKQKFIADAYADLLKAEPVVTEIPAYTPTMEGYTHIKAVTYEGLDKNGQKTKVFAYIGFPEGASADNPVPGIVLVHGGGGHAFLEWVKMWNDRGYAAIAMDNTGYFPTEVNAGESEVTKRFAYGLSGIFREDGFTNAPNNDDMASSDGKVENMWMYHAVGQTILANSILRADPRVDKEKIGVTGISWGGVITAITIGWDNRFAFAIPIYGSAYLTEARAWMGDKFAGESTQALWSAAAQYGNMNIPTLWLCWNDDSCFSVNSNSMSYLTAVKNNSLNRLSILNNMYHSHGCAWNPVESEIFANSIVKGTAKMPDFAEQPTGYDIDVKLNAEDGATVRQVKLYYITEPQTYSRHQKYGYTDTFMDQTWKTTTLKYDKSTGRITGTVPAEAAAYYIEVSSMVAKKGVVICSSFVELK